MKTDSQTVTDKSESHERAKVKNSDTVRQIDRQTDRQTYSKIDR